MRWFVAILLACLVCAGSACFYVPRFLAPREYYFVYATKFAGAPNSAVGDSFEDEGTEIRWRLSNLFIDVEILNKTDRPLRVHWADSSITIESETESLVATIGYLSKGVTHTLDTPGAQQAPSDLAPFVRASFMVFPRSHSRWQPFARSQNGFWTADKPLWGVEPDRSQTKTGMQTVADSAVDRTIRISLALERGGATDNLVFDLQVTDATVTRVRW